VVTRPTRRGVPNSGAAKRPLRRRRNKERNTVARCINKIKAWRRLAMRSDKKPESYLTGLQLRGAIIWMRSLKPAT
jgi:transposase